MNELVTGEAVVLGLRPARLPSRALAILVDLAMTWTAYILLSVVMLSATASMDDAARAAVSVALFVLVLVGVPIIVETLSRGRSLGKLACGLRVVREDGGPVRFRHALVRGAMGAIEIVLTMGVVACIASLVSARGRRLGDVFAGTVVVRERIPTPRGMPVLPPPPPWLAAELGALDLSRVPDSWWLTVRQFLTRISQLDPQVGGAMAARLTGDLSGWTGASVPAGMHPAVYLAAVVGERQAREAQRAFGAPLGAPGPVAAGAAWGGTQAGGNAAGGQGGSGGIEPTGAFGVAGVAGTTGAAGVSGAAGAAGAPEAAGPTSSTSPVPPVPPIPATPAIPATPPSPASGGNEVGAETRGEAEAGPGAEAGTGPATGAAPATEADPAPEADPQSSRPTTAPAGRDERRTGFAPPV
ncbi:RDD family protein [Streptomyces albofaciens JCM 4342]|uniref:RDD family protein n=1 Tax=Streptomyces albofaciens TaxID=66866 RepID=UPI001239E501|nr:RDD family protein [Streptomyces albofaciens]KAA6221541.1 RDD family protein [Streptomyces albofaciens JCM 4342]